MGWASVRLSRAPTARQEGRVLGPGGGAAINENAWVAVGLALTQVLAAGDRLVGQLRSSQDCRTQTTSAQGRLPMIDGIDVLRSLANDDSYGD